MLYATKEILCCKEPYEVLYGTSFRGLELIILLRAFRDRILPQTHRHLASHCLKRLHPENKRTYLSRFFYKGIDHMFLFSKKID